jgi:hypothetical protein
MGASSWDYVVSYGPDLSEVLTALRQKIFTAQEYYFPNEEDGWPATMEQLFAADDVQYEGTHSVLDIFRVIESLDKDGYGTLRALRADEQLALFGTAMLTRSTFERAYARRNETALGDHGQRWSGYSAVLHDDDGVPREIAIWGYSGD